MSVFYPDAVSLSIAAGTYDIGIGLPGEGPLRTLPNVTIDQQTDLTLVAYAVDEAVPFNVLLFNTSKNGLADGQGRVYVGHGANDPQLDPVNIVTVDEMITQCEPFIPNFALGTTFPAEGGLDGTFEDFDEGTLNIGFNVEETCPPVFGNLGVEVPVNAGATTVLIAVDEDTGSGLSPQLYAIINENNPVPLIPAP